MFPQWLIGSAGTRGRNDMTPGVGRRTCLDELADRLDGVSVPHPLRVAVDGRTASGKTTLADELAACLESRGRSVIRTSVDSFHRSRAERYQRGRLSAEGYYRDARDLDAIQTLLLEPLGPEGDFLYATASFDLAADRSLQPSFRMAEPQDILIVDGTFLQRRELASYWDYVIFVKVPEDVARDRGIRRDAAGLGGVGAASEIYDRRYCPAFAFYETECFPQARARAVWDNSNFERPILQFEPFKLLAAKPKDGHS